MNPLQQMAQALAQKAAYVQRTKVSTKGMNKTETIRSLLKSSSRPLSAAEIAFDMDEFPNFGAHLVWLLMKYDMQKGRVLLADGRYTWNHEYDRQEAEELRAAIKLRIATADAWQTALVYWDGKSGWRPA